MVNIDQDYYVKTWQEVMNRQPNKSAEELEFDRLADLYEERFGVSFGYNVGGYMPQTEAEAIAEVKECLRTGKPQERDPQPTDGGIVW